jgi:hypothetical protein
MMLAVSHLRLHLRPERDLHLPARNKGTTLRGGFGNAFRKLVCVDLRWECAECSLRFTCPYTKVFNPFLPPDAEQFRGNPNIPRPFVFKPPLSEQTTYSPGDPLVFDLVVVGSAVEYLPYFIVAFRELGAMGFGLNRAKARLDRVEAISPSAPPALVYEASSNMVRPVPPLALPVTEGDGAGPSEAGPPDNPLTLNFLTPTTLKTGSDVGREGEIVRRPAFHHIVKRLRDRVNALSTFYGPGPLDLDFKAMGDAAEVIATVADRTEWVERSRVTRRDAHRHDLSGFVGSLTVCGDVAPFLPLLRVGEYVHVGKNAVFGNGWFEARLP